MRRVPPSSFLRALAAALYLLLLYADVGFAATLALTDDERAFLSARSPLRVATKREWAPIDTYTSENQYRGLSGDYLYLVAQRLGVALSYEPMASLAAGLEALAAGRADVVPSVSRTPAREPLMRFSQGYVEVPNVYVARRGVEGVGDGHAMQGLRVAVEQGYAVIDTVRERHPQAQVVVFEDTIAALRGVSEGAADVYLGALPTTTLLVERLLLTNLEIRGHWRTELSRLHFGFGRDDARLQMLVDRALADVTLEERQAIHRRWVPTRSSLAVPPPPLTLSDDERATVAALPPLRAGYDLSHHPYTFRDASGVASGIAFDYLALIADRIGITLDTPVAGNWPEVLAKARGGQVDLLPAVADNPERERELIFVGPWISTPTALLQPVSQPAPRSLRELEGRRIAVLRDGQHQFLMGRLHPRVQLVPYDTRDALAAAVGRGEVDGALTNVSFVLPRLRDGTIGALKIAGIFPELNTDLYLAVRRSQPQLATLLSRALGALADEERATLNGRWAVVEATVQPTFADFVRRYLPWLAGLAIALLLLLMLTWRLSREVRRSTIAERALAKERDRANALADARAAFVTEASHEIRTPINAIAGALDLLGQEALPPPASAKLGLARRSAIMLREFVDNLLDLSKIDAGRLALHPIEEDVRQAVEDTVGAVRHLADHAQVRLISRIDDALASRLLVDPMRLRQLVLNLVSNAIKFTPAGGEVTVSLQVASQDATSQSLAINVQDTGVGMSADKLAKLFVPYEQLQPEAPGAKQRGTGLGLVIVKRLVEAMGGTIALQSAAGQGTRATIALTLARGRRVEPAPAGELPKHGLRVLLADDDSIQRILIRIELEALGCTVDDAADGSEALELWRAERHALVITDCRMPGMDGLALCRAVHAENPAVVVVGTSADLDIEAAALAAGMARVIPKPVSQAVVADVVTQAGRGAGTAAR